MDEQAYLEPDFEPSSLTIPRLRSILVAHNVNYPSSAKKSQLVDLFNEHVQPQARKMRSANARVKRTSRGIENVPSSQSTVDGEDEDDDLEETLAPPSAAMRNTRRATRARTEEAEEVAPTPRAARHSTAPPERVERPSSKHARSTEPQEAAPEAKRPASRRSRPSTATAAAKCESEDAGSPFSTDNVFQSGSSPPAQPSRDTERRRTTMTTSRDVESRRSRDARRKTEEVKPIRQQLDGAVVPTRSTFDMPVSRVAKEEVEPMEEFTPEEHQELVQAQQSGELVPARRKSTRPTSSTARVAPLAVTVAMLIGLATVWRQEKVEVGYCGIGRPTTELAGVQIPDWAEFIRPQCEPCPPHAFCDEQLKTDCESGFVLTQHPLSFGGVVPLAPTCEPDSARARKVGAVKDRAVEELREQNARYECGEAAKPAVKESQLKQSINTKRRKGMTNEEFEDLWASAIGEIQNADEVVSGTDGSTGDFTLRSQSLARLPLACAVRRSLRETLRRHLWQLIGVVLLASGAGYGRYSITSGRETEVRAKQLATLALEKLSQQASLHAWDPDAYAESYISMAQLRDDVLREEFSAKRRKVLWEKVQKKVEGNANVRPMVREGRSGDVGRVWEWVGAVGLIESPGGGQQPGSAYTEGGRRKSGRVSFGGVTGERLIEARDETLGKVAKWEEGRQYY